jgi:hypothetical protein
MEQAYGLSPERLRDGTALRLYTGSDNAQDFIIRVGERKVMLVAPRWAQRTAKAVAQAKKVIKEGHCGAHGRVFCCRCGSWLAGGAPAHAQDSPGC